MPIIRGKLLPSKCINGSFLLKPLQFFCAPQVLVDTVKKQRVLRVTINPNGQRNTDSHLNSKNVIGSARQRRILAHVSLQVEVIDSGKVLQEMFSHSIKCYLI